MKKMLLFAVIVLSMSACSEIPIDEPRFEQPQTQVAVALEVPVIIWDLMVLPDPDYGTYMVANPQPGATYRWEKSPSTIQQGLTVQLGTSTKFTFPLYNGYNPGQLKTMYIRCRASMNGETSPWSNVVTISEPL